MADALVKADATSSAPVADIKPADEGDSVVADANPAEQENGTAPDVTTAIKNGDMTDAPASTEEGSTTAAPNGAEKPKTPESESIRKQVEYYLGNANLPTDKFLWETTGGAENKPVPLKTICRFKRMRKFTSSYNEIVEALKKSDTLVIAGEGGNETVQRKDPYKPEPMGSKKRVEKSVYIKGFGEEEDENTQDEILAWISGYGAIDRIKLRRDAENSNKFKGSIFAEFNTPELAEAFLKLSPAPKYHDKELQIMKKADYLAEKNRQILAGEIEPSKGKPSFFEGKFNRGRGGRGRGNSNGSGDKTGRDNDKKNGFKGGRGGRGGRGFRGRGRGGRGRGGRDNNDRNNTPKSSNNVKMPTIQATNDKGEVVGNGAAANGKRSREDDNVPAPPAKKVDAKTEAVTA